MEARKTGILLDSYMIQALSKLGLEELQSPIKEIDKLVLNRQRALWLNCGYAIAHRREFLDKKLEAKNQEK